jgi:phage-related tail fiber protein
VFRDQLASLAVNVNDNTMMLAEMLIPSATGNFAIHEIGVFDAAGALFAYGNFPATWKPVAAAGSTRDMTIQAAMKVSDSSVVNLVVDTSIVLATRNWVTSTITRAFLLPGGLTGQVLAKKSNADGDTQWVDPTAAVNIVVDVIKEMQTTTSGQSVYTLTQCTTDGVAMYIEGSREFGFTALNATQVQLDNPVAAGTRVWFVQNDPNDVVALKRRIAAKSYFMGQFV